MFSIASFARSPWSLCRRYSFLLPVLACLMAPLMASAQLNFGSVQVGGSATETATVTFYSQGVLGSIGVLTQGAAGLDFGKAGTGTCTPGNTYAVGATCTVGVTFKPARPWAAYGAVVLYDGSGKVLANGYLLGTGVGPRADFLPGMETTVASGGFAAADAAGNLYIVEGGAVVKLKLAAGKYVQSTVASGLTEPVGVAVDGGGNVYISDGASGRVLKETLSGGGYTQTVISSSIIAPDGVAVDGNGNVYVANNGACDSLFKLTPSAGGYTQSAFGSGLHCPEGVAVDGNGVVYIADTLNDRVVKETPSGGGYTQTVVASGLNYPQSVAVDGNGNVFVADTLNDRILKETLQGSTYVESLVLNTSGFPGSVAVDGSGNVYVYVAPGVVLKEDYADPPSLGFANTKTGSASGDSPKAVQVQNAGNGALTFTGISYPVDFPEEAGGGTDACTGSTSLSAGQQCNLNIDFVPQSPGKLSEGVILTDNALNVAGAQQSIAVSGVGLAPVLTQSSSSVSFPSQLVNSTSAAQPVTLANSGDATLIFNMQLTGPNAALFSTSTTCMGSLAAGANCTVSFAFRPTAVGTMAAALTITDNTSGSPHTITLLGTGIPAAGPALALSATSVSFPFQEVHSTSGGQQVTLTNAGNQKLVFQGLLTGANAGSFSKWSNCSAPLAPGASCTVHLFFTPAASVSYSAALTITDNDSGSPHAIGLTGTGTTVPPAATLSATSVQFGNQAINATSFDQPVILTNSGGANLVFLGVLTGPNAGSFSKWSTCTGPLTPGASCTVHLFFSPTAAGPYSAALTITDNTTGSPHSIALSGTGVAP